MRYTILYCKGDINVMQNDLAARVRDALRIEDVIGRCVSLRKTYRGWSGLCPFHDDKAPSFHVYADSQSYYCFGCHESGDIFTFVMKTQNLTFPEALGLLADEAGIKRGGYSASDSGDSMTIYDIMRLAQEYFTSCLERLPGGMAYLESRGLARGDASAFGLGYAPDSWDGLMSWLKHKGVGGKMMADSGLVIQGSNGMYDRFRGRVIFPVKDIAGRVTAFGGRAIVPDAGAKYINSPETEIYSKRRNLYLLDMAGSVMREKGYSILCEGYMDALRLHKAGFRESVASLGTSLTEEQAGLIKRFADRCYICYDGDSAGQKAALRGMYILAENGLDVRVVRLPDGQDPDDFLRANPPEAFSRLLDTAMPLIPCHIEMLKPELNDPLRRRKALHDLWEGVKKLNPDDALNYVASLSGAFMIPPDEMRRRILAGSEAVPEKAAAPAENKAMLIDNELECAFCAMLMRYRECRLSVRPEEIFGLLTDDGARLTAAGILSEGPENASGIWRTIGDTEKDGIIARGNIFLAGIKSFDAREKWIKIYSGLESLRIKRRIRNIEAKVAAGTADDSDMQEFTELKRKIQGLKI